MRAKTPRRREETGLVWGVINMLNRLAGCEAWRNNTGVAKFGTGRQKRKVHFGGEPGAADVFLVYGGAFIGIECKTAKGKQDPDQIRWQSKIEAAGGRYLVARSKEEVLRFLGIGPDHPTRISRERVIHR